MAPTRVLQVIGRMNRGGAETMIMNLYRNVDREKVQFDFVEHTSEECVFDSEIKNLGGRIFNCPKYNGKNHFEYTKWWKSFFKEHPEYKVIHGHIGSTASIYLGIAKKAGLFTIAHSHNTNRFCDAKDYLYLMLTYPTRFIADYFFFCSDEAGISRYGKKVFSDKSRYSVLNNAIDTKLYEHSDDISDSVRKEIGIEHDDIVIGHVGRFNPQKNHPFLIDIFAEVAKLEPKAKFLLVGGGDGTEAIQEKVNTLGLSDKVIFTGVRSDVNRLLQSMDVFVFPSLYEGLPVTLVEAQASGLPCVMSDKVPTESIITDGLITVKKLTDTAEDWAKHVLSRIDKENRKSRCEEIKSHGYDIAETAKWLEEFYLERSKK